MTVWPQQTISSVGTVVTGSTPLTSNESFYGGETPFVTPAELDQIEPLVTAPRTLSAAGCREVRLLPEGAVMVCCIGSLGKVGITGRAVATNQQINSVIFDKDRIWPRFGFYACRRLKKKLETMAPATTLPIVSKSKFESLTIPVPTLEVQQRIAEILDRAEALRAKRREALAKLDAFTQSIFLDLFGDPEGNPRGFPTSPLADVVVVRGGFAFRSSDYVPAGIPLVRIGEVNRSRVSRQECCFLPIEYAAQYARFVVRPGDLLMSLTGTTGKDDYGNLMMLDGTFDQYLLNQRVAWLQPRQSILEKPFLFYALRRPKTKARLTAKSRGIRQANISNSDILELKIPVPPLSLQEKFSSSVAAIQRLQAKQNTGLNELEQLLNALQHRAFRGTLDV